MADLDVAGAKDYITSATSHVIQPLGKGRMDANRVVTCALTEVRPGRSTSSYLRYTVEPAKFYELTKRQRQSGSKLPNQRRTDEVRPFIIYFLLAERDTTNNQDSSGTFIRCIIGYKYPQSPTTRVRAKV